MLLCLPSHRAASFVLPSLYSKTVAHWSSSAAPIGRIGPRNALPPEEFSVIDNYEDDDTGKAPFLGRGERETDDGPGNQNNSNRDNRPRRFDNLSGSSWMDRNSEFNGNGREERDSNRNFNDKSPFADRRSRGSANRNDNFMGRRNRNDGGPSDRRRDRFSGQGGDRERRMGDRGFSDGPKTFRQDFRGTRVFVQGLPLDVSWQALKDHFRLAGEVVFASVSADPVTGESKGHGVVQYETTDMAKNAIAIMRDHPLNGHSLFVREDMQENHSGAQLQNREPKKKGPTPPTMWKCANDENAVILSEDEVKNIMALIKARDDARFRKQYEASDSMRQELKDVYGVYLHDRLKMWWVTLDGKPPQSIRDAEGPGSWDGPKEWRQIPTIPEQDTCVDPNLVNALLKQRDIARKERDFSTADALLAEARDSPDGDLSLLINDDARTWRVWTNDPPPRRSKETNNPGQECIDIVTEYAPEKVDEIIMLLNKFPGREYNLLKKLKQRYVV